MSYNTTTTPASASASPSTYTLAWFAREAILIILLSYTCVTLLYRLGWLAGVSLDPLLLLAVISCTTVAVFSLLSAVSLLWTWVKGEREGADVDVESRAALDVRVRAVGLDVKVPM